MRGLPLRDFAFSGCFGVSQSFVLGVLEKDRMAEMMEEEVGASVEEERRPKVSIEHC